MKVKINAENLQIAFTKAAKEFGCSVTDLDINIIQHPRVGIFGLFKKEAIIEATHNKKEFKNDFSDRKKANKKKPIKAKQTPIDSHQNKEIKHIEPTCASKNSDKSAENLNLENKKELHSKHSKQVDNSIFDSFHKIDEGSKEIVRNHLSPNDCLKEIRIGLDKILSASCFNIAIIELSQYSEDTVYIKLDGEDAALLIGKEGYRYKAMSYILFNWINAKYGLGIRLEIAEFLKNQEAGITLYLTNVIEKVENLGRAQTKPLDGVLVKIALEQLRARFPNKYVGIKNSDDGRYVIVNDFHKK